MSWTETHPMDPILRNNIDNEMRSGERITWSDQPVPALFARKAWVMTLFGLPWTAFAIFWILGASGVLGNIKEGPGPFSLVRLIFPLFGVPFVLIGLGMISSPLWMRRAARRTAYLVTNQRALIVSLGWRGSFRVRSFGPEALSSLESSHRTDGSGDLIFAREIRRSNKGPRTTEIGFIGIQEVRSAEAQLRALIQSAPRGLPQTGPSN